MNLDIVMITTGSRPKLLEQSLRSLRENATNWSGHRLTLVMDGCFTTLPADLKPNLLIVNPDQQGASRSRNIGASSTPRYLRHEAVMFVDDDIYACKGWDLQVGVILSDDIPGCLLSGHAHPFNHTILQETPRYLATTVLSTVHFCMRWPTWDRVGFWTEPGGAGGSEDVDYCNRAGLPMLLTKPQCILHTGISSSHGGKLVGWEHVMDNNRRLERVHGVEGKVIYE